MKSSDDLEKRRSTPAMPSEEFRRLGHQLVDDIAALLEAIPTGRVTRGLSPGEVKDLVRTETALPEHGTAPDLLLRRALTLLGPNSLFNGHPKFWGYITSSPAPLGILGDLMASALNPNLGGFVLAPVATEIEVQTVRWIAELINYPVDCGGLMVSGGNMANFVGFLAARADKAGYDVRTRGTGKIDGRGLTVYASRETHTWIQKAADMFGLGTESIRWIDTDDHQRVNVTELAAALREDRAAGHTPMLVSGSAGTVSTGATDNLPALAELCREYDAWFHVDGAYGGFAAAADSVDPNLSGLSEADSVAVDPHKWLYAPLEAGCSLVRDREKLRRAFSYHPTYYHLGEEAVNFFELGMQNSRSFRALKVWLLLQQLGRSGYRRLIEDDIRLAGVMYDEIAAHPELEALTYFLSITTFRYVPADLEGRIGEHPTETYLSALNKELLARLEKSGELFVSNAVLGDRFVLRACIVNFNTTLADVRAVPEIVVRLGREVDTGLRASFRTA
jgi:glutamate/tyrosine decarboxylase-like PLP-dependent enzyme